MDTVLQDLRFGVRMLLKAPGFALVVIGTLALGIGAATAVFGVLDRVVLRPLPVREPDALVHLALAYSQPGGGERTGWNFSYPGFLDLRDAGIFSGVIAHTQTVFAIGDGSNVDRVDGAAVSAGFFTTLGAALAMGRDIRPDEDRPGASQPVVVVSYDFWQRRLAGAPDILGRALTINGRPFTVIGVAAPEFRGLVRGLREQAWVPVTGITDAGDNPFGRRTVSWLDVIARLKPGEAHLHAEAGLAVLAARLRATDALPRGARYVVVDGRGGLDAFVSELARPLRVLMAAVVLVLVVVCANVAGLLLARGAARYREISIRRAVGAGRPRLVRQLATESLLLAALGGAAGLLVASWIGDAVPSIPTLLGAPLAIAHGFDGRILGFALVAAAATAVGFGLVPALQASRPSLVEGLREAAAPAGRGRFRFAARDALVVAQVAVSLVLLTGAGVLFRTARNLHAVVPGYDPSNVLLAGVDFDYRGYTGEQARAFWLELLQRMRATPGVEAASVAVNIVPSPGGSRWDGVPLEGYTDTAAHTVAFDVNRVGPGYFAALRIPVLAGRAIGERDQAGAPRVAVINETMARRYWPDRDPLGRRMWLGADTTAPSATIVGVVQDGKYRSLREEPTAVVYWSALQGTPPTMTLIVRTRTPLALVGAVRSAVHDLDPAVPVFDVRTLDAHLALASARERLLAGVGGLFAGLALALAAVGLFGLLAFTVARRTREIGVRLALGARPADVIRMVVGQGTSRVVIGVVMGGVGAVAATRLLRSLLYGVSPGDPVAFAGAALLLVMTGLVAAYVPARRAARVDPMAALRTE